MIHIYFKYRPSIGQKQISDYMGNLVHETYNMTIPAQYYQARKRFKPWLPIRQRQIPKAQSSPDPQQTKLDRFVLPVQHCILAPPPYTWRFRSVRMVTFEDYASAIMSEKEYRVITTLTDFDGFFEYLPLLNDFAFFDDVQASLEADGHGFKGLFIYDIILYAMFSRLNGLRNYAEIDRWMRILGYNPLVTVIHNPDRLPTAADVSYVLTHLKSHPLRQYFLQLVQEALLLKIIQPRILIWDGQFIRSNCENNKKKTTQQFADSDAGYYRHTGKKMGVGYVPGILYAYCGDRAIPIYFKMFPGNRNDNPAFRATILEFLNLKIGTWGIVIVDAGAYSEENLQFCQSLGLVPIIRARKNLKSPDVQELKPGYWFNRKYLPAGWTESAVLKIFAYRTAIERGNAPNNTVYNASRMNTRGRTNAEIQRYLIYILELLQILTAYKLGRHDLIGKFTAFGMIPHGIGRNGTPQMAKRSHFQILDPSSRQKTDMDKKERRNPFGADL
jgi:hypothetical protein